MLKKIWNHYKVMGKPLTVHTEMINNDKVWAEIQKKVKNNEVHTWYLITPLNSDIFYPFFRLKESEYEYDRILVERYNWLKRHGQRLQLHVHLSKNMDNMSYDEQKFLIRNSISWFENNLNIKVKEMVPGWWNYNEDTEKILKKFGIKLIKRFEYKDCHDYDWIR